MRSTCLLTLLAASCSAGVRPPAFDASGAGFLARGEDHRPALLIGASVAQAGWGEDALRVHVSGWSNGAPTPTAPRPVYRDGAASLVERNLGGLIERWEVRDDGLEHSFVVSTPAVALTVSVAFDGAAAPRVDADGLGATLTSKGGVEWRYEGLVAVDAGGRSLPARMVPAAGGLDLVVDAAGAVFPVTVDPLLSTPVNYAPVTLFGDALAGAGDVDGDGYDDMLASAPTLDAVYLYYGSADGLELEPSVTLSGATGSSFGLSVGGRGDVNGDGYSDVVVGAPQAASGAGAVHVFYGGEAGISEEADVSISGAAGDMLGGDVAMLGDVNGDGYDDVGAGPYYGGTAAFSAWHGSASGLNTTRATGYSTASRGGFGQGLRAAGDVNGDGYADVVYGLPASAAGNGEVRVYKGGASGLQTGSARLTYPGAACSYGAGFGRFVDGAGDVNGDGYDDVVVGGYPEWPCAEGAYVYYGAAAGVSNGSRWAYAYGASVAGGLDLDGDAYSDIAVGSYDQGEMYVFEGASGGLGTSPDQTLGSWYTSPYGQVVAGLGDVNGDGCSDVAAQIYMMSYESPYGVDVYYGDCPTDTDADGDGWSIQWDCNDADASVLPWHCGDPDQLVVDGTAITVSGTLAYDAIWVVNGGSITASAYDGSANLGWISLQAGVVYVDATSALRADGAGYRGGTAGAVGSGSGGGAGSSTYGAGGGYGGKGGDATTNCSAVLAAGGAANGSDSVLALGSGGGGGLGGAGYFANGARGGGAIEVVAGEARLFGTVSANGAAPTRTRGTPTGGGGAGGGILIDADDLTCAGSLSATGGAAGALGFSRPGSGAGGRIDVSYGTADIGACTLSVSGGANRCASGTGATGSSTVGGR